MFVRQHRKKHAKCKIEVSRSVLIHETSANGDDGLLWRSCSELSSVLTLTLLQLHKRQTEAMQACPSNLCPFLPTKLIRVLAFYIFSIGFIIVSELSTLSQVPFNQHLFCSCPSRMKTCRSSWTPSNQTARCGCGCFAMPLYELLRHLLKINDVEQHHYATAASGRNLNSLCWGIHPQKLNIM